MNRRFSLSLEQQALVKRARPSVGKLAASVARRHGTDNADDLAQLGMLKAVELVGEYDAAAGASFDTFIFRTARRVMVSACRVERRERALVEAAAGVGGRDACAAGVVALTPSEPETPEHLLAIAQERARLCKRVDGAMARLTNNDRALVRACACEGESLAAAARRVGVEYQKARYGLTVAMASLGKWLKKAA